MISPAGGVLTETTIGVRYASFSETGSQTLYIEWANRAEGSYVIQAVVKPEFIQTLSGNDEATKSITVGPIPDATVSIEYLDPPTLLIDADGDAKVSPGDTLEYRLDYANNGETDVTGVVVLEDYDERLVGTPINISDNGILFDGTISWDLGEIAADEFGSVTYQVVVNAAAEFPSGTNLITNNAFIESDQTVPVSDTIQVGVKLESTPPETTASSSVQPNAAGWYNTDVNLVLEATDNAGGSGISLIIYSVNGGDAVITPGDTVSVPFTEDGIYSVSYYAVDAAFNVETAKTIELRIDRTGPTPVHNGPYEVVEGSSVLLDGTSSFDGLSGVTSIAWDINNDGVFDEGSQPTFFGADGNRTHDVQLRVVDAADNVSIITTQVLVTNAAPVIESVGSAEIDENGIAVISGSFSDAGALDSHQVIITWGDGTSSEADVDENSRTFSASHQYPDDAPTGTAEDTFVVGITVEDDDGGNDSDTTSVLVRNVAPEFDAGENATLLPPVVGFFSRTIDFTDPGSKDQHTVTVDFGDGSGSRTFSIPTGDRTFDLEHTYTADGTYQVSVTLSDDDLGTQDDTFAIEVLLNTPPIADAGGAYTVNEGSSLLLDASLSSDEQNNITGYAWDLDNDGQFDDAFGVSPTISGSALAALGLGDDGVYLIAVEVTDAFNATDVASTAVTVNNVIPVIQTYNAPEIDEDGVATITGSFTDVGTLDTHTVTIDWGDGTTSDATVNPTTRIFVAEHQYLDDDPSGAPADVYTIGITVTDDDNDADDASTTVTVNNVAPVIQTYNAPEIDEDGVATITGSFTDVGTLDTHTVTINWGDGTTSDATVNPTTRTFVAEHQYLDDDPSGTPADVYTIGITVTDDDNDADNASTTVTVNNIAPELSGLTTDAASLSEKSEDKIIELMGTFTDIGSLDTHVVSVDWGDGTNVETVSVDQETDQFTGSHSYTTGGVYEITVTLTDDDGGTVVASTTAFVEGVGIVDGTVYIVGTEGRDHVNVNVKEQSDQLTINVLLDQDAEDGGTEQIYNGLKASEVDRIVAFLSGGDDHYNGGDSGKQSSGTDIEIRQIVFGGSGRDNLTGGRWADALFGEAGRDSIDGRSGHDILVGGSGRDKLRGGDGNDLLIGGSLDNDFNDASIIDDVDAAMTEWGAGNLADALNWLGPIIDDEEEDKLFGGDGDDALNGGEGDRLKQ